MGSGVDMQRRAFIALVGGAAAAWPIAAQTQSTSLPRIGVLLVGLSPDSKAAQHFRRGLRDAGYFEGRNVVIEWRYAKGDYEKVRAFVDEFVRSKVNVMVMDSTIGTEIAKRATSTVPILIALALHPRASGLIESLAKPGANVTGLSIMSTIDLNSKPLQLLKDVIPTPAPPPVILNPDHPLHAKQVGDLK